MKTREQILADVKAKRLNPKLNKVRIEGSGESHTVLLLNGMGEKIDDAWTHQGCAHATALGEELIAQHADGRTQKLRESRREYIASLDPDAMREALAIAWEILFPAKDPEEQWDVETIEWVSDALSRLGIP